MKLTIPYFIIFLIAIFSFSHITKAQVVSFQSNVTSELVVCGESQSFSIQITNDSTSTISNLSLNINFPQGITYVTGSITETTNYTSYGINESSIADLSAITVNIGNLPKDSTVSMIFSAVAGYNGIAYQAGGNVFRNNMTLNYNNGTYTVQTPAYNILYASLSVTSVNPMTKSVFVGETYSREITIVNGGFGRINTLDLNDIYDSTKIKTIATDKGILSTDGSKVTLTASDFTSIGNGDGWLDLNESITLTETIYANGCVNATSQLYASWGCASEFATSNSKYPFTDISLYAPNLLVSAIPNLNLCLDINVPNQQQILLINAGTGPANDLEVEVYQTWRWGNAFNAYSLLSKIDENSIQYKIGSNGTLNYVTPTATATTPNYGSFACLGANPVGQVFIDLPVLQPGDSIFVIWDSYTCDNFTACNGYNLFGWDYNVSCTDMCYQQTYNKKHNPGQTPMKLNLDWFPEYPTDISDGQAANYTFRFIQSTFAITTKGTNPYFSMIINIPDGLNWSGNNSDLKYINGITEWIPTNVTFNNGILEAHYPFPIPFSISNSEFQLNLTGDCSQGSGTINLDGQLFYIMDSLCAASKIPITCNTTVSTQLHCAGSACLGMAFNQFNLERSSFGAPDNNLDGLPDASGSLDINAIKLNRVMTHDTFTTTFAGNVHTNSTIPNWQYGYAASKIPYGDTINIISASITVIDQNTGLSLICNDVPFTSTVVNGKREVMIDYSPTSLTAAGCNSFNGFVFEDGDQVTLIATYKVTGNIGTNTKDALVTDNEFYLSNLPNPITVANKYSCDDWNARFTLIGYELTNTGSGNITMNSCTKNIKQYYNLQVGQGNMFNDLFPFEYRNWYSMKEITIEVPSGYSVLSGRFFQYSTKYTNASINQATPTLTPSTIVSNGNNGSIATFDIAPFFTNNGGSLVLSDERFYGFFRVSLKAIYSIPQEIYEDVNWGFNFNKNAFIGGGETGNITANPDRIRHRRAKMIMSSAQQTMEGQESSVTWTLNVKAESAAAPNAFLAFWSTSINVLEVRDAASNALIPMSNGIYKLGSINRNGTKAYKITATYDNCNLSTLEVFSGYDCDSYPAGLGTSSGYQTYPLYIDPQPAELQVRITGASPNDPCEPRITIEMDMLSSKLAYVEGIFANIKVPTNNSLRLETDSIWVQYPYGTDYQMIANPILVGDSIYAITLADMNAALGTDGLVGITNTAENRIKLKFNLYMNSNFQNGDIAKIIVGGYRACGLELPSIKLAYDPNSVFTKADNSIVGLDGQEDNWSTSFGDYDNDGFVDLFLVNYTLNGTNQLYHNNGDGTFTKITSGNPIVTDIASSTSAVWGDYDNDGDIDLFVSNNIGFKNFLYRNEGNGQFTSILNDPIVNYTGYAHGAAWSDYDNDGYIDLFIADYFPTRFNKLYHNNGDGTFTEIKSSPLVTDASFSVSSAWGDYDNDGDQDLFVSNTNDENNFLYRNEGNEQFTKITTGDIVNDGGKSVGASWGDYDNDLDLDLFVSNSGNQNNFLYKNNGDGTFTKVINSVVTTNGGNSHGSAWADYDNDGDIDLLVSNDADGNNFLFTNNNDGTFSEIGNIITQDAGKSFGAAWADIDNDLDLDLHISNHDDEGNFLYINERGRCTSKACFTFVGTNSNTDAYGSKVKVLATINGVQRWQMRALTSLTGGGIGGQNELRTLIGLADAPQIDSMIIEWPSGVIQGFGPMMTDTCWKITEQDGSIIRGRVYNDENLNCQKDNTEHGIPNLPIIVQPGNRKVYTNADGEYSFNLAPGTYLVTQEATSAWKNSCNNTYTIDVIGIGNEYDFNDFADTADCQSPDLSVELASTALRVGFENLYAISIGNNGTETADNVVLKVNFDQYIIPLSASLDWDNKVGTEYTWNVGTLGIGESFTIYIEDSVSINAIIGNNLTVIGSIYNGNNTAADCNSSDNIATDVNPAVGAIDPNDIQVSPEGFISVDQELVYKIRFQNVGNDLVNTVILRDKLPEGLDMNTLIRGAASHPYQFKIEGERTLIWEFSNINLLDSTTNEAESHGFATFKIIPKSDLEDGIELPNQAQIFFDNSAVVLTNTVVNTIGDPAEVQPGHMSIYPNPMTNYATIRIVPRQITTVEEEIQDVEIFSPLGVKVLSLNNFTGTRVTIERNNLEPGYYLVQVTSNKGTLYIGKLLVQ